MTPTAPASRYHDPATWAAERQQVFARSWQFMGLAADVDRPGDYLADVFAGYPLFVIRGEDGVLRGFHNVCRHRAGPLFADARGRCDGLIECRYHGWRYAQDGRLRSAVGFGADDGFDPRDHALFPIDVDCWRGLVFVNPDPHAAPLAQSLAPLDRVFGERATPPVALSRSHEIACNWKVYVENYLEGYHIAHIHPSLAAEIETEDYVVRMDGDIAIHEVPVEGGAAEGIWAWMWPNLAFNLYRGVMMIEHMRPLGLGRTRLDYLYLHDGADAERLEAALRTTEQLTREDTWICERVQQNLEAGIYASGALSPRHENAVAWFQSRLAEALAV